MTITTRGQSGPRCTAEVALSPTSRLTCVRVAGHAGDHRTDAGTTWATPSTSQRTASTPLDLKPGCRYGFTRAQVEQIAAERIDEFDQWMRGQTIAICRTVESEPCSAGHGPVVYEVDVRNWLAGGDPLD